jgi:hypothetical protein
MTMTNVNNSEAGGSSVRHTSTITHSDKHQARLPKDHFKRLLKEACLNHPYPVRHKLRNCGMMRNFMTSRFLTWGAELDEGLYESDTMPFLEENTITMVYGGHPPLVRRHVSNPIPRVPTRCGWGHGGVVARFFPIAYKCTCAYTHRHTHTHRYINIYIYIKKTYYS